MKSIKDDKRESINSVIQGNCDPHNMNWIKEDKPEDNPKGKRKVVKIINFASMITSKDNERTRITITDKEMEKVTKNSPLNKLKFTKELFELMWNAKIQHLVEVSDSYSVTEQYFKENLYELLEKSNMNMGACNTAVGFIINSLERRENNKNDIRQEIRNQILISAIYYANGLGIDPN